MSLYDVPSDKLVVPDVSMVILPILLSTLQEARFYFGVYSGFNLALQADFEKIMERSISSVAAEEVERYVEWTREFGQDG